MGRKRRRRGQRKGQIYFLCAVDLDDGPLSGHCGLWLCGFPQGGRPIGLQVCVCAHCFAHPRVCVGVQLESWSPSPLRSPAVFQTRVRWC